MSEPLSDEELAEMIARNTWPGNVRPDRFLATIDARDRTIAELREQVVRLTERAARESFLRISDASDRMVAEAHVERLRAVVLAHERYVNATLPNGYDHGVLPTWRAVLDAVLDRAGEVPAAARSGRIGEQPTDTRSPNSLDTSPAPDPRDAVIAAARELCLALGLYRYELPVSEWESLSFGAAWQRLAEALDPVIGRDWDTVGALAALDSGATEARDCRCASYHERTGRHADGCPAATERPTTGDLR